MAKTDITKVMGILNVTPDSFSDGGKWIEAAAVEARIRQMLDEGADIIDVGGESTRPGAESVSEAEELKRILPAAKVLQKMGTPWSIDTQKAAVAELALDHGATIVNDVSALRADEGMAGLVAKREAIVILMHRAGEPKGSTWSTEEKTDYGNSGPVVTVKGFLLMRAASLTMQGINRKKIWIDPGLGFGKTVRDNFRLLSATSDFVDTGYPVLIGASRKSMLASSSGGGRPADRLAASLAAVAIASWRGAACVRVHDVKETVSVIKTVQAIKESE